MKVSIITVCKNSEQTIENAFKSVIHQNYNDIEFIVIDGKSIDNTLQIIEKYRSGINVLICEKDNGIYNAMNKGIKIAKGDIIYFLNSDDYFYDNHVIKDVVDVFLEDSTIDILYGNIIRSNGVDRKIVKYNEINRKYFYKSTICHQAIFTRRKAFKKIGEFEERYVIHADTDWLLRAYFKDKKIFKYFDRNICFFSSLGFCSNSVNAEKYKYDRQEISAKYYLEAKIKLAIKRFITSVYFISKIFCLNKRLG